MQYVLGVDGGNTKTDFLLFTAQGDFVDALRGASCSHESGNMGYDWAFARLKAYMDTLLQRNSIGLAAIASAAFGLAGVDLPHQHDAMFSRLQQLGFPHMAVANDAILGIQAISRTGSGICSVNGTGTVTIGIDPDGHIRQVGGIGAICGDAAGASHIATLALAQVHDQFFRCAPPTLLRERLMTQLGVRDAAGYLEAIHDGKALQTHVKEINIALQQAALAGDPAAISILEQTGDFLGRSAAGCIRLLSFGRHVDIALIGSVWVKCAYGGMRAAFERALAQRVTQSLTIEALHAPPAAGAVVWALMLLPPQPSYSAVQQKVLPQLALDAYEKRIAP